MIYSIFAYVLMYSLLCVVPEKQSLVQAKLDVKIVADNSLYPKHHYWFLCNIIFSTDR